MARKVAEVEESNKRLEKVERLKRIWKKKMEFKYYSRMVKQMIELP